jgi:hypothetical protein
MFDVCLMCVWCVFDVWCVILCRQVPKYQVEYVEKVVEVQSQVAQEPSAGQVDVDMSIIHGY